LSCSQKEETEEERIVTQAAKVEVIRFCALGVNNFLNAFAPHQ